MRGVLRPILLPLLRRNPLEVERAAKHFSVRSVEGKKVVAGVGRAFLGGYHTMLETRELWRVGAEGADVESHHRPFFFEGAAMGYLPRAYFTEKVGRHRVEADLLAMDPKFLYLYYVGLGFWFGFRHSGRPGALEGLAPHLDPFYMPLAYDGFGFKLGFFDVPKRPAARAILDRAPENRRAPMYQGFGRALFFVCMEDEDRFQREKRGAPAEHRKDLEAGRSLALAFNDIKRPERILAHLAAAAEDEIDDRLLGVTWALTAREMNDPDYFESCLATLQPSDGDVLRLLPQLCRQARELSATYPEWRWKTKVAAVAAYAASVEGSRR
jgi:hypothetical protein